MSIRTRALSSARERHDTERAEIIAAFGDIDERAHARISHHRFNVIGLGVLEARADHALAFSRFGHDFWQFIDRVRADHKVDQRMSSLSLSFSCAATQPATPIFNFGLSAFSLR